jgi:hypothetical protein
VLLVAGDIELNPTKSLKFAAFGADTGCGEAYWVADVVVAVGGAIEGNDGAEVWADGVADWKSSKSSSSAVCEAVGAATGLETGIGSSNENRSISGSFFFGGSGFFEALSPVLRRAETVDASTCLLPGAATAPSSYSSYSSNLSRPPPPEAPRLPESWKSLC